MAHRRLLMALLAAPLIGLLPDAHAAKDIAIVPSRLPSIALIARDGGPTDLAAYGERATVLNVWATWCPPCRKEMPALQTLGNRLAEHGVQVVVLSVDQDVNLMEEFLLKYGITLPAPVARSASDVYRELDAVALPVTFYVKAGGGIVAKIVGAREWGEEAALNEVLGYLRPTHSAQSGAAPERRD